MSSAWTAASATSRARDVLIEGSKIVAVRPDIVADGATVIDAGNMIVMPGFIDTHRHMWQAALRNVQPDATLADYFRVILNKYALVYRPEDVYAGNLLTALGALDAGVTTVLDWSHIQNTPEHTDAAVKGLQDAGARAVFGYGSPQKGKPYFQDQTHAFPDDIRRIRKQFFNSDDQLLTLALAGSVPGIPPVDVVLREWKAAMFVRITLPMNLCQPPTALLFRRDDCSCDLIARVFKFPLPHCSLSRTTIEFAVISAPVYHWSGCLASRVIAILLLLIPG